MLKVAEIGINWDGNITTLRSMIRDCAKCGVDAVKIQYLKPGNMYPAGAKYNLPEGKKKIGEYLSKFELSLDTVKKLHKLAQDLDILLGCTVTDVESVLEVEPYIDFFKVASSSLNYIQLHQKINKTGKNCVISVGGAKFQEIEKATRFYNSSRLTILHCNYEYPTELKNVNLDKILKLKKLGIKYGFSNHTLDYEVTAPMCVALGCDYYEFHVTPLKEREEKGDHHFSLTYPEVEKLCKNSDIAEIVSGDQNASLTEKEKELRGFCYRKAFTSKTIKKGSRIDKNDIKWLRNSSLPGAGFDPEQEYMLIGKVTKRDLKKGEKIQKEDLFV